MEHTYIKVKYGDYEKYFEKYGHNKLDKWNRIIPLGSSLPKFISINEEIFEGRKTNYNIYNVGDSYIIEFKSINNNSYRFDCVREPNTDIFHLAFSELNKKLEDSSYEDMTNRGEAIDVFSRLIWILGDINSKINASEYCIGGTFDRRKNKIYEYMLRFVSNWEKRQTDVYDTGWGIYFKL